MNIGERPRESGVRSGLDWALDGRLLIMAIAMVIMTRRVGEVAQVVGVHMGIMGVDAGVLLHLDLRLGRGGVCGVGRGRRGRGRTGYVVVR